VRPLQGRGSNVTCSGGVAPGYFLVPLQGCLRKVPSPTCHPAACFSARVSAHHGQPKGCQGSGACNRPRVLFASYLPSLCTASPAYNPHDHKPLTPDAPSSSCEIHERCKILHEMGKMSDGDRIRIFTPRVESKSYVHCDLECELLGQNHGDVCHIHS